MKIPKPLIFINSIILLVFLLPVIYMFWRFAAFSSNLSSFLESWDTGLVLNTFYLFIAVVTTSVLLGVMLSILVRVNLPFPKIILH